eukprot:4706083-Prymnesium_polylepis.1
MQATQQQQRAALQEAPVELTARMEAVLARLEAVRRARGSSCATSAAHDPRHAAPRMALARLPRTGRLPWAAAHSVAARRSLVLLRLCSAGGRRHVTRRRPARRSASPKRPLPSTPWSSAPPPFVQRRWAPRARGAAVVSLRARSPPPPPLAAPLLRGGTLLGPVAWACRRVEAG